jgi:hypothetical protein
MVTSPILIRREELCIHGPAAPALLPVSYPTPPMRLPGHTRNNPAEMLG